MSILFLSVDFHFYSVHISNIIYHLFSQVGEWFNFIFFLSSLPCLVYPAPWFPLPPSVGGRGWMNYVGPTTKPKYMALRAERLKLQTLERNKRFFVINRHALLHIFVI